MNVTEIKADLARRAMECHCEACVPQGNPFDGSPMRFIVCAICGNKRCPHATDHRNACSNSNELGQKGSAWERVPPTKPVACTVGWTEARCDCPKCETYRATLDETPDDHWLFQFRLNLDAYRDAMLATWNAAEGEPYEIVEWAISRESAAREVLLAHARKRP